MTITDRDIEAMIRCPIISEYMTEDAMTLNCTHHFSERGLKKLFITKNISYNLEIINEILMRNKLKCPLCRVRITTISHAYEYRNVLQALAQNARIVSEQKPSQVNSDVEEASILPVKNAEIFDVVPLEEVKTESLTPMQITEHIVPEIPPSESKSEKKRSLQRDLDDIMSEHDLNKTRYGMKCLSYRSMVEDTAKEALAFREKEYIDCCQYACLARVKRAVSIPFLAFLACAEGCCEGFCGTCCCCLGCSMLFGAASSNNSQHERHEEIAHDYCILSGNCYRLSSVNCLECTFLALCCLANCCVPEVADAKGQIKSFHYLEERRVNARSKFGRACDDIFG